MPFPSKAYQRLASDLGRRRRWSKYPKDSPERAAQMARVRDARFAKYQRQAEAIAAEQGYTPTPEQLEQAARDLANADLAAARLKAYTTLSGGDK